MDVVEKDFKFKRRTFEANKVIFEEGRQGKAAYMIVSGAVEIRKGSRGRNPLVLAKRKKGDVIGELALIDNHPHMAAAVAVVKTEVLVISRKEFQHRIKAMDPVMQGIIGLMTERLRQMADMLLEARENVNWSDWSMNP